MSAAQFLERLYGALPEFFKDENELRRTWGAPDTRKALLADKGFGREPLADRLRCVRQAIGLTFARAITHYLTEA